VFNNTLPKILPSLVSLVVIRLARLDIEHISVTQVRTKLLSHLGPAHELMDGKESEELSVK
jgi:hypothetical protein